MPPTLTYPGVYIEEISSGVHTITGVATSIAAFAGWAPQGPTDEATLVQSWMDFQTTFGGLYPGAMLGYSVNQFFANGGQQAYIVRLSNSPEATVTINTSDATAGSYVFTATEPGLDLLSITVTAPGSTFTLAVSLNNQTIESFQSLGVPSFVGLINSQSKLVSVALSPASANPTPAKILVAGTYPMSFPASGFADSADTVGSVVLKDGATNPCLLILARSTGSWSSFYGIAIQNGGTSANLQPRFGLSVIYTPPGGTPTVVETYPNLSMNPSDPQNRYVVSVIAASLTIQAVVINSNPNSPATIATNTPQPLIGGKVNTPLQPKPVGDGLFENLLMPSANSGAIFLLTKTSIFNIVAVPGLTDTATIANLQAFCWNNRAFLIVDCASTDTFATLQKGPPGSGTITGSNSVNSAFYFPWVQAPDPLQQGRLDYYPPCGFVAGNYAATDAARGVWKAPAGIGVSLTGATGLAVTLTDLENGTLNTQAINCLRNFPVYGNIVWGARTLQGNDQAGSQWKYIPIRRLALFLESSLLNGTQWVVFEPNDERLWGQIRLNVGAFMQGLFLQGAFQGTTPQQAYFVKCDSENNPQSSIDQGIVNILVGFAPLYPAEFVVIQIQQLAGQLQS